MPKRAQFCSQIVIGQTKIVIIAQCHFISSQSKCQLCLSPDLTIQSLAEQMKKSKPEKPILPISLSSKKPGTSKQESLFTPYKINWKDSPSAKPLQENNSSRFFFKNMKNELTNIKNDVERLIRKDGNSVDIKSVNNSIRRGFSPRSKDQNQCRENQIRKKCSSFTAGNIELSQFRRAKAQFDESERKEVGSESENSEAQSVNNQKLTELQEKMMSLEYCNREILSKLNRIEGRYAGQTSSKMRETVSRQLPRQTLQSIELSRNSLTDKANDDEPEQLMQSLEKNGVSSSMLSTKTEKLEEKIEQFEKQMERLHSIIIELQNSNKITHTENQMLNQQLSEEANKAAGFQDNFSVQKREFEQRVGSYASEIEELKSLHDRESKQINAQFQSQQNEMFAVVNQLKQHNMNLVSSIGTMQQQCEFLKNRQHSLAIQFSKERESTRVALNKVDEKQRQVLEITQKMIKAQKEKQLQIGTWKQQISVIKQQFSEKASSSLQNKETARLIQELQEHISSLEFQLQGKSHVEQLLASQHESYIQKLESELQLQRQARNQLETRYDQQSRQVHNLEQEAVHLSNVQTANNAESLGKEFELKINQAYDQIYVLKKKVNLAENQLLEANVQRSSLQEAVRAYEDRDREADIVRNSKGFKAEQYDRMEEQIRVLTKQNEDTTEKCQMAIMKLQNQLDAFREQDEQSSKSDSNSVNVILKSQLQETDSLRASLREKSEEVIHLKTQLREEHETIQLLNEKLSLARLQKLSTEQISKPTSYIEKSGVRIYESAHSSDLSKSRASIQSEMELIKKKQESIEKILEVRNKELKMKDEFITSALIGKINKKESEDEVHYLLKELQVLMRKHLIV